MSTSNDSEAELGEGIDADVLDALLEEYRTARARIQSTVDVVADRRRDALACAKGCASCCVDGLSVLEVEAAEISLHLATHAIAPRAPAPGACKFLDADQGCTIYAVRPWLCRTHGLPLRMQDAPARGSLRVVDDVAVCSLNFVDAPYTAEDVLDAEKVQMLLTVVNSRFCAHVGIDDATARVPLASLAEELDLS